MNKSLYCRVRAEDNLDANSGTVYPDLPRAIVPPQISGQPHLRGELTCTRGTWDDTPERRYAISYQWYRSGTPISGATDPAYVLGTADLDRYITCRATAEVLRDSARRQPLRVRPVRHGRADDRGHRPPAPRAELHARRVERLPRQPVRADLPVVPQQHAHPGRRRAGPHRRRRGRRQLPALRGHRRGRAHRVVRVRCTRAGSRCASACTADNDATAPNASNAYTLRVRNDNPVPVTITTLEFDHARRVLLPRRDHDRRADDRPGAAPAPDSLTLRWTTDFQVPASGRVGRPRRRHGRLRDSATSSPPRRPIPPAALQHPRDGPHRAHHRRGRRARRRRVHDQRHARRRRAHRHRRRRRHLRPRRQRRDPRPRRQRRALGRRR